MKDFFSRCRESLLLGTFIPLADMVMGTSINRWNHQIRKMQSWSTRQIAEWQNEGLASFISHAYYHTKYYHTLFNQLGIKPEDIRCANDLVQIPYIDKQIVNAHFEELIPDNISKIRYRNCRTGGTTGQPMNYYCDEDTWGYVTAAKIFYWGTTDYNYGDAFVALGSSSLFNKKPTLTRRIYDFLRNEHSLNSVDINDEKCAQFVSYIRKKHILFLYGYAASLYMFTQYVAENNIDLTQIRGIFTTSENLPDNYREMMERTFNCQVMDCYGARDAGITAYEKVRGCYQVGYNVIAEIIDKIDNNMGTLLSTNFLNYSFPLIRYQFGDVVELDAIPHPNEYNGQIIRRIIGRTSDVIRLENGHSLSASGISVFMKAFDIVAFDFKKTAPLEIKLRIQPKSEFTTELEKSLRESLALYIGKDCNVIIEYVSGFECLPNGKHRYFYT